MKSLFIRIALSVVLMSAIFMSCTLPAFANSAQSWFEGVNSTGAIMTDEESPIVVEHELLTFDISEFPETYYNTKEAYLAYSARVTAEYTFYNPSEYTVTAKLLFPFGSSPHYANGYYDEESGEYVSYNDTEKYGITINGEPIETKIRHTLSNPYDQFEIEKDLPLVADDFVTDAFYTQDTSVTKYTFSVASVDTINYSAACIGFDIPQGLGDYRICFPEQYGFHIQDDGDIRITTYARKVGQELELYVFGTPLAEMPDWKAYKDGGAEDADEINCSIELVSTESLTFKEFALEKRSAESVVSEIDWYNAVVCELNESQSGTPNYPIVYCDRYNYGLSEDLMRWYEYEITLNPGERIVNAVTAPMYPAIDLDYNPDIYEYTYLLSPAKTWKSFGELEIVINTPFYVIESSQGEFEKREGGYYLKLDTLPEGELRFALSASEDPKQEISPYTIAFFVLIAVAIIVPIAVIIGIIAIIVAIIRRIIG